MFLNTFANRKLLFVAVFFTLLTGYVVYSYLMRTFDDTSRLKPDLEVSAIPFIAQFENDPKTANARYSEKIVTVKGRISELESSGTVMNIKMTNPKSGSFIIFSMQPNDIKDALQLKVNDSVAIKGSCSNGTYSNILSAYFISFKRCTLKN